VIEVAQLGALASPWIFMAMGMFLRLAGLIAALPLLSDSTVPVRSRAAWLVWTTLLLVIGAGVPAVGVPPTVIGWVVVLMPELLVGVALGTFLRVVVGSTIAAGQSASMMMGLGFATIVDPSTGAMSDTTGRLLRLLAVGLLVAADVHLYAIDALRDSFQIAPFGAFDLVTLASASDGIAAQGTLLMSLGFRLAAPVVMGVLMVYVVLAVIAKVAPQMNLFAFGFVITIPTGLVLLVASMPQVARLLLDAYEQVPTRMLLWLATGDAP
jgi:flagellar biosynthetic protein FliR